MPENGYQYLALGDYYTIGDAVNADERWPVQLAHRLRKDSIKIDPMIVATTGWTTDELQKGILKADLEGAGFVFDDTSAESIILKGIPAILPESDVKAVFEQLISDVEHQIPEQNFSITDLMAKSIAKSLAIKTGQELSGTEQMHLVDSLFACKESNLSPSGQLAFYIMEPGDIEKKFK